MDRDELPVSKGRPAVVHTLLCGQDELVSNWVADRIPWVAGRDFGPSAAIGVVSEECGLIAGVVYHDLQRWADGDDGGVIELSMAASNPMWARKENIRALLAYPFEELGVFKVRIATPHTADHNIRTFEKIGFKREAVLANEYGRQLHAWIGRMRQPDFTRIYGA